MELEVATVIPGTETPTGDGTTGAVRCVLVTPSGGRRAAILKRGSVGHVAAEAFSSLVLRAWGLTVPDPYLIQEPGGLAFASADIGYPNLKQHLGLNALPAGAARDAAIEAARLLVGGFPSTGLAAACDEAIDNRDRNLGNILWDGNTEAWIDHAFAVGQGTHMLDANKLCVMAVGTPLQDRVARAAVGQSLTLDQSAPTAAEQGLQAFDALKGLGFASYVAARLTNVATRLIARFPAASSQLFV